jgi:hypothetical protein
MNSWGSATNWPSWAGPLGKLIRRCCCRCPWPWLLLPSLVAVAYVVLGGTSCRFAVLFLEGREGVAEGGAATMLFVVVVVVVVAVAVYRPVGSSAITRELAL